MSVHRLDFSLLNVRRIVAKTVLSCTRHIAVERHVAIRSKALALTDDAPFDGNSALAVSELIDSCHECNTNLSTVMSVIWGRLNQTKTNMPILLALHLLKNLITHGPLTAIIEALDGAGKIYELKSFSDAKSVEQNREVRQAADHVYEFFVDLSSLFTQRRRIAFSKAQQQLAPVPVNENWWSDYIVRRLPLTIEAQKLHALYRPYGMSGRVFCDADNISVAPSVAASTTRSIMALSRLNKNLMKSSLVYDEDEEDRLFGPSDDQSLNESVEDRHVPLVEKLPAGESRSSPQTLDNTEEDRAYASYGVSGDDLIPEQEKPSLPTNALESFNYAVSSYGGSAFSVSERSGSPLPSTQDDVRGNPSTHRMITHRMS